MFNEIVGLDAWRKRELELSADEELLDRYGTGSASEISEKERADTEKQWKK
jgi:hypothetical protein